MCSAADLARKRLLWVRQQIERNRWVAQVFPALSRGIREWTQHSITIERPATLVDASVEAYGISSAALGGRCDLLILDDVCSEKNSLVSATERQRVVDTFFNTWRNMLDEGGRIWSISTPWHYADLTWTLARSSEYATLFRGIPNDLTPLWPEKWPREALEKRRAENPLAFARSFHCKPIQRQDSLFKPEWFRWYKTFPPGLDTYMGVDPAFSTKAQADYSAIVVVGKQDHRFYVLEAIARRLTFQDLLHTIASVAKRWKVKRIGVETVQAQKAIADMLKRHTDYPVQEIKTSRDKYTRMALLATHFQNERIWLRGNAAGGPHESQLELYEQLVDFGAAAHDDLCDALDFAIQAASTATVRVTFV